MAKDGKHPGFKGAAAQVAKREGVSKAAANRIIGYGKAHASTAARKRNHRLNKTGGRGK